MIYLAPIGGLTDCRFGILATPGTYGIPRGIRCGLVWAADNQAFTKAFNPQVFFPWLNKMLPWHRTCLFVACPDIVGDASATLESFRELHADFAPWPLAFVAQDGQESLAFPAPDTWSTLFIGGSTRWKMSPAATECIQRAQRLGKRIHVGRVNYYRRYRHFASMPGSESWTCDGTRTRYERDRALSAWKRYMVAPRQYPLFMPPMPHDPQDPHVSELPLIPEIASR